MHPHSYSKFVDILVFPIIAAFLALSNYVVFMAVPNERVMGAVQRIFYFHVGSATACYCAIAVVLCGSIGYLATYSKTFDKLGAAAAEVAFIFCSITLFSGMIWGHSAWNTWFRWEPRLVTFLLLWLILLSLILLRVFGDKERVASHAAVLGIVGAITVPLVIFSIKLLPDFPQLHPVVVENQGLRHPMFVRGMFLSMGSMIALQAYLIYLRTRIALLED